MRSNRISKIILNENIEDIDIDLLFHENFDETVKGIFVALQELLLNYTKNTIKINSLINIIYQRKITTMRRRMRNKNGIKND